MMNVFLLNIILFSGLMNNQSFFSTHFIGMHQDEIKQIMLSNYKTLKLNTVNVNDAYNYLKYEDRVNEITVLFFLDEKSNCKMIRFMSDYSNINDIIEELNSSYRANDKSNWLYVHSGKDISVNLEEGDWFFTITINEKKAE